MSNLSSILKKVNNIRNLYATRPYVYQFPKYYKSLKVQKNTVLIESTHARNLNGHLFRVTEEICRSKRQLKVYVAARDVDSMIAFLKEKSLTDVIVIRHLSKEYCKVLASAEYLLNDTSFYPFFTKKHGQKYYNIWHGTPLKTLGKDQEVLTDMANIQRNFYMADKIITSNQYTQDILASSHNLNGIYQGKMVLAPSPRNSILLDQKVRQNVRLDLGLNGKKVYLYMPTWRGTVGKVENNTSKILDDLKYISKNLKVDELFFVKLHPFQDAIELNEFDNIRLVPNKFELYEFLTAIDTLITDYSSIMYDFLLTNRKIILYTYDKEEYFSTRGVYDSIDSYPFEQVNLVEELIEKMQDMEIDFNIHYAEMKKKFCPFDHIEGTTILCDYLFDERTHDNIKETNLYNEKETVVILSGGFWDNGITMALLNTFDNIDISKRNYVVFFEKSKLKKEHEFRVRNLPEGILFYPVPGIINGIFTDRIIYKRYMKSESFNSSWIQKRIKYLFENEFKRTFGDLKIDHFIHYTGFERKYAEMIKHVPSSVNSVMFYHTDMIQEYNIKKKLNQDPLNKKILFSAYERVSKVVLVHQNLKNNLLKELPHLNNLHVVNNFLGEKRVRNLAKENIFSTMLSPRIDYANQSDCNQSDIIHLMKHRSKFFESSLIYQDYSELNIFDELESIKSSNVKAYNKILAKIHLAELSLMVQSLGKVKSRLLDDLFNPDIKVFINIGRYAYQKGHDRLIAAFERVYVEDKNTRLVIVAPHGPLRKETINWVKNSRAYDAILILGRMDNPYPLLKLCDAFVLSSHYEGLGLVVYEALAVNTTPITVNLTETIEYLKNEDAIIVNNSEEGLYEGMTQYLKTEAKQHNFNFSFFNERSREEIEAILEK